MPSSRHTHRVVIVSDLVAGSTSAAMLLEQSSPRERLVKLLQGKLGETAKSSG